MAKGRRVNEMNRVLVSEDSTIAIFYHPLSRMLFCAISDADDDTEKIKQTLHVLGNRFWKKHQDDVKLFRTTTEKSRFETFTLDVENITMGGRVAEIFPKLLVIKNVLDKIKSMGMISDFEFQVALMCTGKNSPLKISRGLQESKDVVRDALKKLDELDIINLKK